MPPEKPVEDKIEPLYDDYDLRIDTYFMVELEFLCEDAIQCAKVDEDILAILEKFPEVRLLQSTWVRDEDPVTPGSSAGGVGLFDLFPRVEGLLTEIQQNRFQGLDYTIDVLPANEPIESEKMDPETLA